MTNTMQDAVPGLIYVPMSLTPGISVQECDDWYNNEHVPIRLRLPYFQNGCRYRATDSDVWGVSSVGKFEWLALYDIADMWELKEERYERLLKPDVRSLRESNVVKTITAFRKYYDHVSTYESSGYHSLEQLLRQGDFDEAYNGTLIVVGVKLTGSGLEQEDEWNRWYEEDHLPPLRKVPGWLRTRRYRTSVIEDSTGDSEIEYLTLNEFAKNNAIGGPEHQIAIATEKRTNVVAEKWRKSFRTHYIQGEASRDLGSLHRQDVSEFVSPDGMTRTVSGPRPAIESCITVDDGIIIPYRLEGAHVQESPVILLCTLAGLSWSIWDDLVELLWSSSFASRYRILRLAIPNRPKSRDNRLQLLASTAATAKDLSKVLAALMIQTTPALLSVGLGGSTAREETSGGIAIMLRDDFHPELRALCDDGLLIVASSTFILKGSMEVLADGPVDSSIKSIFAKL